MNVFITAVNSFVGSHLAVYLKSRGHQIFGSSRAPKPKLELQAILSDYHNLNLNQNHSSRIFSNMDVLIHCAHSHLQKNNFALNFQGTKKWFMTAKAESVDIQIFITSYSAKSHSHSAYALVKNSLENFFISHQQPVVRPGLILGNGGLFFKMMGIIDKYPLMPLIDSGKYKIPIISINTLSRIIEKIIRDPKPVTYNVFQEQKPFLIDMLKEMKKHLNSRCILLPVPLFLSLNVLKLFEKIKLPFPIKSESIAALKENQKITRKSSLSYLKIRDEPYQYLIKELASLF